MGNILSFLGLHPTYTLKPTEKALGSVAYVPLTRTLNIASKVASNAKVPGRLTDVLECRGFLSGHRGFGVVLDSQLTISPAEREVWKTRE